jgi:nucleoside-diphosphate-sugar epimerase
MGQAAGQKMKILIIGGTGFISGKMTEKLLARGHEVTLFNRGKSNLSQKDVDGLSHIYGDRNDPSALKHAAEMNSFDIVYDMIAYQPEESKSAIDAFKGRTGRFVHCSTISVYMVSNEVTLPITEDQDKRPLMEYFPRNPFGMQYGIDKRKCEDVLWEHHDSKDFPVTIVRPTFVSGPSDPAKRDYFWIQRILDSKPLLVPGTGEFRFQQIYIDDCAEIFCRVIETDISIGEAYNAAAEEAFTLNEYLHNIAAILNMKTELVHIDQKEFDSLDISYSPQGDVFPFNTRRDTVFSLEKVKKHLDYKSTPFNEWMKKTIDWFNTVYNKPSTGYEDRHKESKITNSLMNK